MYSKKALKLLEQSGISIGDYILVEKGAQKYEGLLLPRPSSGDENCLVIKLISGYNIGVDIGGSKLSKLSSPPGFGFEENMQIQKGDFMPKEKNSEKKHICLITTGGTIASKIDYKTGAVHPRTDPNELVDAYPMLKSFEPIRIKPLFSVLSENMAPHHWAEMAKATKEAFDDGAGSVVIAHGTDTMGYSAAALSYALQNLPAPVILTGAQRSPDRASSDAPQNMYCSLAGAKANFAAVALCMHATSSDGINHLHWGTRVRKSHTSGRWAFRSISAKPFGTVNAKDGKVELSGENIIPADLSRKIILRNKFSDNVHLAWIYPGITSKMVSTWSNYDGVVIAGTGLGHAPVDADLPKSKASVFTALQELSESGVVVAVASQCFAGRVLLETYSTGRLMQDAGVIGNGADWLAETAYVKLCWALGQEKNAKKAKELMMTPIANDITPFSAVDEGIYEW